MQVILIEPDSILNDLIAINLKNKLHIDVVVRENEVDAIELLKILPNIDLIITRDSVNNSPTGKLLVDYLESIHSDKPIIIDSRF